MVNAESRLHAMGRSAVLVARQICLALEQSCSTFQRLAAALLFYKLPTAQHCALPPPLSGIPPRASKTAGSSTTPLARHSSACLPT